MSRKNKNGKQDKTLYTIVLLTAITNLVAAIIDIIDKLTG